jgi:hypothetical protein
MPVTGFRMPAFGRWLLVGSASVPTSGLGTVTINKLPVISSHLPDASGQWPAASSQQPAASGQTPAASSQKPAARMKGRSEVMENNQLDETGRQFMIQLLEKTGGDPSVQVSMYDIGSLLGLEREDASRVAEDLIALQVVEIKTLSGGIGISAAGAEMMADLIDVPAGGAGETTRLGDGRLLNSTDRQSVEQAAKEIKNQTGSLGLDFDTLSELMADLKTIDVQLGSSRPKTAIIRECLHSISEVLKRTANNELHVKVNGLLGD